MMRTLHEELRAETRREHVDLETALNLLRSDFSIDDYIDLLVRYQAFYATFDQYLGVAAAAEPALKDFIDGVRQRKNWLMEDMRSMGVAPQDGLGNVPCERFNVIFPHIAHLFGAMYVIEGSALGGVMLAKHFGKLPGIGDEAGLRFFYGYGSATKEKWASALHLLATADAQGLPRQEILDGAKRTFALLHRQLVNALVM